MFDSQQNPGLVPEFLLTDDGRRTLRVALIDLTGQRFSPSEMSPQRAVSD
jgi:hypothetical protein